MQKFISILFWVLVSGAIVAGSTTLLNHLYPSIPVQSYLIQSGSMEPTIHIGDVILIQPDNSYQKNDVVTFTDSEGRTVTHRIIEETPQGFITKGDANQTPDPRTVAQSSIQGKVIFTIPKLGFLVAFSKTKTGILLFIVVPVVIIIYDQIRAVVQELSKKKKE